MGAREGMGTSIGGVAMFAYRHLRIPNLVLPHKIAPAATPDLAQMTGSGVAAAPVAPEAVSGGRKKGQKSMGHGASTESTTRRGMTLAIVLSGRQPSAPLASPST